jgi:hypothetical protein
MSSSAIFDTSYYLTNNADVVIAISQGNFANALDHYNQFGGKELRQPNSNFNPNYYAINNADVLNAVSTGTFVNVFAHYQEFGEGENRAPSTSFGSFDAAGYLTANTDVAAAVTAGSFSSALDHFLSFGQSESRSGSGVAATIIDNNGSTFSLTTDSDGISGTSLNDNIQGQMSATASLNTQGLLDSIDGGAGTDTFILVNTTANAVNTQLTSGNVTNVEVFDYRATGGGNLDFDTAGSATSFKLTNISSTSDFSDVRLSDTVEFVNAGASLDTTITYNAANITGTADSHTITLNGVSTGADIALSGAVETINLTVAAATSITDLDLDGGTTALTIAAAGAFTITNQFTNAAVTTITATGAGGIDTDAVTFSTTVTTYDGSANTGVQSILMGVSNATITTGTGADVVDMGVTLTSRDTINLGDGADTLRVDVTALAAGSADLSLTGVETLRMDNITTNGAIQMDNVAVSTVRFDSGAASAQTITLTDVATTITDFSFLGAGTANADLLFDAVIIDYDTTTTQSSATLTINNGGATGDDIGVGKIDVDRIEAITVNATEIGAAAADELTMAEIEGEQATDIIFTANGEVIISVLDLALLDTADFSDADGGVTITDVSDSAAAVTLTMGDGNDSVTFTENNNANSVTIDLGAGNDTFVGTDEVDTVTTGTGSDTVTMQGDNADDLNVITDFTAGSGGDIIDLVANVAQMAAINPTVLFDTNVTIDDTTGIIAHGTTVTQGAAATVAQATAGLIVGTFDGAGGSADAVYILFDDATDTYFGLVTSDAQDDGFTGDGIVILATLQGVADATTLTAANFADFI